MHRWLCCLFLFLIGCSTTQLISSSFKFTPPTEPWGLLAALPTGPSPNGKPDRFAVIIGLNAEDRHRGNISLAYQVLVESGFKSDSIFILDIASTTPIFPKTDTTSLASVRLLMKFLSEFVDEQDEVVVYVTGHGRIIEKEPHLVLNPSEFMASSEFLASLDAIRPGRGLVIFDQCYWSEEFHPKSCRWATMTVARPGMESTGSMLPRQFWYAIRQGVHDVSEAFNLARFRDDNTRSGENDPKFLPRSCGIEKTADSVIQY